MDKIFLGSMVETLLPGIESLPINKVEILDDNGDILAEASSNSIPNGKTLTVVNPDGTTAMAAYILSQTEGYVQRSYEGRNALLDPAAELGDGVTVGGIYSVIAEQTLQFDELYRADISAPDADEIDDEYPYKSPTQRLIERNMAKTRSLITKTSDAINLRIDGVNGEVSSLKVSLGNVQSEVSGKIDGSTAQSLINQSINKIELSVSSGSGGSTFTLTAGNTTLSTDTLDLHVKAINIDGTLKANQIQTGSIYVGDLADGSDYATKTYVTNNAGLSQSEVDDRIDTYIDSTSITAETLRGRTVELLASNSRRVGTIELIYTTSGDGIGISTDQGGIRIESADNVYIASTYNTRIQLDDEAAKIGPNVWATNGTVIYDSDRNLKNSIEYDLSKYRQFLLDLKPCRFKFNDGRSGRYHLGVIAQDVEQSLADNGITPEEFSGWCKSPIKNKKKEITGYTYGIRYDSFIPLSIMLIQELMHRVKVLEERG